MAFQVKTSRRLRWERKKKKNDEIKRMGDGKRKILSFTFLWFSLRSFFGIEDPREMVEFVFHNFD